MPKKFPPLTPQQVIQILTTKKFQFDRQKGSHAQYVHPISGRTVTVDMKEKEFGITLMKSMIHQSGLSREEFYGATKETTKKT